MGAGGLSPLAPPHFHHCFWPPRPPREGGLRQCEILGSALLQPARSVLHLLGALFSLLYKSLSIRCRFHRRLSAQSTCESLTRPVAIRRRRRHTWDRSIARFRYWSVPRKTPTRWLRRLRRGPASTSDSIDRTSAANTVPRVPTTPPASAAYETIWNPPHLTCTALTSRLADRPSPLAVSYLQSSLLLCLPWFVSICRFKFSFYLPLPLPLPSPTTP